MTYDDSHPNVKYLFLQHKSKIKIRVTLNQILVRTIPCHSITQIEHLLPNHSNANMSSTRNPDSITNTQGEFHPRIERDEPLTTHGVRIVHFPTL